MVDLAAGSLVPADGLVLEARDFLVSEASLTGEAYPVEKQPGVLAAGTPLARRTNAVYLGTSVRSGKARVLVVHTGERTAFGAVAERLRWLAPETEFARGVQQFGVLLVRVMVVMVLFVLIVNQWLGRPWIDSMLFAVALAVGLLPELLPAIVSVTLSAGARRMAERGVIVRHLEAIENLGSMDVLCTDKTGTLTAGAMRLDAPLLPFLPLAAKQILLNNFLSDLPSMAIASDRVDADRLAVAQHWDVRDLRRYMLVFGLTSTVFDLLTFGLLLEVFNATEPQFQTAWFVVSLLTELVVVLILRTQLPAWKSRPGTWLWTTTALVAGARGGAAFHAAAGHALWPGRARAGAAGQPAAGGAGVCRGDRVRQAPLPCDGEATATPLRKPSRETPSK
ncbi:MAG: HAD-IC family P-type ATPase [Burkholderiaceae bacterium]|nr:HAD-IC family P-type ATPase [Burkholderiaceae bacterium]